MKIKCKKCGHKYSDEIDPLTKALMDELGVKQEVQTGKPFTRYENGATECPICQHIF